MTLTFEDVLDMDFDDYSLLLDSEVEANNKEAEASNFPSMPRMPNRWR